MEYIVHPLDSISRRQPLHQIIPTIHTLILLLLRLVKRPRNSIDEPIKVRVAEVSH